MARGAGRGEVGVGLAGVAQLELEVGNGAPIPRPDHAAAGHRLACRIHEVTRPVIMDARVEQLGGYRFVYVLPLGEHEIFIEDTYYQDEPTLDVPVLEAMLLGTPVVTSRASSLRPRSSTHS